MAPSSVPPVASVTFASVAHNLVPDLPDDPIRQWQIFLRDRLTGTTQWISDQAHRALSLWPTGISADGRFLTYVVAGDASSTTFLADRWRGEI